MQYGLIIYHPEIVSSLQIQLMVSTSVGIVAIHLFFCQIHVANWPVYGHRLGIDKLEVLHSFFLKMHII
jgi:hypothetical protein